VTRTAIVGGSVVSPQGSVPADVLIDDGVILQVGEVDRVGAEVLDAGGCLVLPGAIDVHTHVLGRMRDDTRSALSGGTTASLVFIDAVVGERPAEAARRALADELPDSLIDLAFHTVIWEPQAYRKGDLRETAELGVGSVKLWLAYLEYGIQADDDVAFRVMQEAGELGMVVLAHCENGRVIDVLTRQLIEAGELGTGSRPRSRPSSSSPSWPARRPTSSTSVAGSRSRRSSQHARGACRRTARSARTTCCSTSRTTPGPTPSAT
jgi:dihydropyrimidinase